MAVAIGFGYGLLSPVLPVYAISASAPKYTPSTGELALANQPVNANFALIYQDSLTTPAEPHMYDMAHLSTEQMQNVNLFANLATIIGVLFVCGFMELLFNYLLAISKIGISKYTATVDALLDTVVRNES